MMTYQFLNRILNVDPHKPALITRNAKLTYEQLFNEVNERSRKLYDSGVRENTIVHFPGTHDIKFVLQLLALWHLGAVPVPLNTRLIENELPPSWAESQSFPLLGEKGALIIFTSGATGHPKGVVLTIDNLLTSADAANKMLNPEPNDSWLASLPFYHIGGIMVLVRAFLKGLTVIIPASFGASDIAFYLKEYRPAFISLVPTVMKRLLENNIYLNSEMKRVLLGGGPVKNELAREAVSKGWKILKVYGSSETCSMFTALDVNNNPDKLSSAGLPLPGNKIKIVNENHEEVPVGESGEVAAAGPTVFREYLNDEALTHEKKKNGYYYTGDLGRLDEDGYLYIESRRPDLIISGGENISPIEIEEALLTYPGIQQVCVIAQPDDEWGQIPAAVIKTNGLQDTEKILSYLRTKLVNYKLPKRIIFINEFPITALGKINREELRRILNIR